MSRHHHSSHHGRKNKQLEFLENYLGTIRKEVDEKTRELDALKLEGMHAKHTRGHKKNALPFLRFFILFLLFLSR